MVCIARFEMEDPSVLRMELDAFPLYLEKVALNARLRFELQFELREAGIAGAVVDDGLLTVVRKDPRFQDARKRFEATLVTGDYIAFVRRIEASAAWYQDPTLVSYMTMFLRCMQE